MILWPFMLHDDPDTTWTNTERDSQVNPERYGIPRTNIIALKGLANQYKL
jgi:hypothetical protein